MDDWGDEPVATPAAHAAPAKPAADDNDSWGAVDENNKENNANGDNDGWGSNNDDKPARDSNPYSKSNYNTDNRRGDNSRPPRRSNNDDNDGGWGSSKPDNDGAWGSSKQDNFASGSGARGGNDDYQNADNGEGGEERVANTYVPTINEGEEMDIGITPGINFQKYDKIKVNVTGSDIPPMSGSFSGFNLNPILQKNVKDCKFDEPTPCQKYSIPVLMKKRDIMCCAQTGSGKTAAFLLPILQNMLEEGIEPASEDKTQTPQAIVLCPTRELVIQTCQHAKRFARGTKFRVVMVYGGTTNRFQMDHIEAGADIVIATPGRFGDMLNKRKLELSETKYIVLDEADRMLDMGFSTEMKLFIAKCLNPDRQIMMYSATFPDEIQRMAAEYMKKDYVFVAIGIIGSANPDITQEVLDMTGGKKLEKIQTIIQDNAGKKILIFVKMKKNADFLAAKLSSMNFNATSIHGDRYQEQREEALREFIDGKRNILVATSVASRGLDIKDVDLVVNYDMPDEVGDYVHRIGRTGRVGNSGRAVSFVDTGKDGALLPGIKRTLVDSCQTVPDWLNSAVGADYGSAADVLNATKDIREYADAPSKVDVNDSLKVVSSNNFDAGWGDSAANDSKPAAKPPVSMAGEDDDWF